MMNAISPKIVAFCATLLATACNYPAEVKTLSTQVAARTVEIEINTREQQAVLKAARNNAVTEAKEIRESAKTLEAKLRIAEQDLQDAAFAPHTTAARKLHLLEALRAEDVALHADAYALLQTTEYSPEFSRAAKLDISGVASARAMATRMRDGKQMTAEQLISYVSAVSEELEAVKNEREEVSNPK